MRDQKTKDKEEGMRDNAKETDEGLKRKENHH